MSLDLVYNNIIKPKLSTDVKEVLIDRGYLKHSIGDYFLNKGYLRFQEQSLTVEEIIELDKVGWISDSTKFSLERRVVVPIRNAQGNILTLVGWGGGRSKYLTLPSDNFSKEANWFNIDSALEKSLGESSLPDFKNSCIVVEGIFDALMLDYLGLPAIATMGSNVSHFKGELLGIFDKVLCIPDNDKIGQKAVFDWKVPLYSKFIYFKPKRVDLGGNYKYVKDIDDIVNFYDEDTVRSLLSYYLHKGGRVSHIDI